MVEYGNGVSQTTGVAGGSHGGQAMDAGAAIGQFVSNTAHTIAAQPPTTLLVGFVVIVVAFVLFRRAF
ncbi:MAG TPA: hypothetical protein VHS36_05550 [Candidatus Limnocylindrales bacterium]|jgi:hypothetical protein|nr:hypothetical protein [Candidatus Limnocylindrales bacterium]